MMYSFGGNWRDLWLATASLLGVVLSTIALSLVTAQGQVQQADSKMADRGGSGTLDAVMHVIEKQLNSTGKVSWTEYLHDSKTAQDYRTEPRAAEVSAVRPNAAGCRLEYHSQENLGKVVFGPPSLDSEHTIMFGDYDYDFVATPLAHDLDAGAIRGGHPEWTSRVEPKVYVVRPTSGELHRFWFYEEGAANRLAAALNQAASLCGTGRKSETSQNYQSGAKVSGERVTIKCDQGGGRSC